MEQIVDIVREERPDVFVLSGDVYHTSQPSSSVQTMFTEALVEIHDAAPAMVIVVTAGNHDSGTKHEIFRTPWKALNVHMIGSLNRECPKEHVIEIAGKGFVVAVPYVNERNLPDGFYQQLLDIALEKNSGLPIVMSAHTTVRGCDFQGHDHASEYMAGGIDACDIETMGEGYDYLALGHIHHEQFVHTGKHNVRYSGTPLAVSFDENYPHSVSIVEIEKHGDIPRVREIEIENLRPLVTLPSVGYATWEDAKELLKNFPDDIEAYIRLNVEIEDFLPAEANSQAVALTHGKKCHFCLINARRKTQTTEQSRTFTVQEFRSEDPIDIAKRYAGDTGIAFDSQMTELFRQVQTLLDDDLENE